MKTYRLSVAASMREAGPPQPAATRAAQASAASASDARILSPMWASLPRSRIWNANLPRGGCDQTGVGCQPAVRGEGRGDEQRLAVRRRGHGLAGHVDRHEV